MRLDGYIRVSKVGGREGASFISPDVQRDQIAQWAALRGVEIAAWHTDLDQSGGKLSRPGLDALLARVRSGETQGVAVARIDRLSRAGVADALRLVESIHEQGGQLAVVDLGIDPTTPFGEFALTVLLALARMQRRQIADQWAVATERAIGRGVHTQTPFGYDRGQGGLVATGDLAVVREVFRRRASGGSWMALATWLDEQGVKPRHGGQWSLRAVQAMIANRAYLGEARYGSHVNVGAHTAAVTLDLFEAAQAARGVRPARGEPGLLSGLVRCAGCRYRMHAATVGSRRQKVYRCKRRHGAGTCGAPASVDRALLEQLVIDRFLAYYGDVELEGRVADDTLAGARDRLAAAEAEFAEFRDNAKVRALLERVGGGHFEQGLQSRVEAVLAARDELDVARRSAAGIDIGAATAIWPDLSTGERRRLLTEGIDAVFLRRSTGSPRNIVAVDPGRVRIFWRGEAPHDLPGPGLRAIGIRPLSW